MNATNATTASAAPAPEVTRLRVLLRERKFTAVLEAGAALLAASPGERDALLCVAVAQRFLGRLPEALRTLATLEQHHPRFSRL
ncbi:MAG: hypothetical protein WCB10_15540, partial [Steroidobacteraceae bacterium]